MLCRQHSRFSQSSQLSQSSPLGESEGACAWNGTCVVAPGYEAAKDFVASVPALFAQGGGETLHAGRNTVRAFSTPAGRLVVKRYKHPNLIQAVAYTYFKKSKAERAYLYAAELRRRGFATPHEVAYIEIRRRGLLCDSYFVSEECTWPPLIGLLNRDDPDRQAAAALASLLAGLHEKGVLHGDLNLSNILYDKGCDGRFRFSLIDTNRSTFKTPTRDECLDNLTRLTHNRRLMRLVMALYAAERGWDADETVADAMARLDKFERKCAAKQRMKGLAKGGRK